ncbi:hypothetical protein AcW1_003651 [Taiwanofungus camphoratus]|nr:hypothetical protein AcW1_003651 [Antrodia cinnamomea]
MNGNSYRGPTSATQKKVAFPHNYAHRCNIGFRGQLYNGIWVTTRYGERGNKPSTGASLDKWIDVLKTVGDRCVEVQKTLHPISYILGTRFVLLVRYLQNEPIRGALSQRCRTLHTGLLVLHLRSGDFNKSYRHVAK